MQGLLRVISLVAVTIWLSACGGGATPDPTPEPVAQVESTPVAVSEPVAQVEPTPTVVAPEPDPTAAPDVTPTPDPAGDDALAVVEAFDPAVEGAIHSLNELVLQDGQITQENIAPALAPLLEDENPDLRWAALYVVALVADTDEEAELLAPVLEDEIQAFQIVAAGSLARLGVVESLPVLIEGLASDSELYHSHPPELIADFARETLEHYTGESFADAAGWQAWWDASMDSLAWDGTQYVVE